MFVLVGKASFFIEEALSLKDKRRIAISVVESIRHKFHIAISQVDKGNDVQRLEIGFSCVSSDKVFLYKQKEALSKYIDSKYPGRMVDFFSDILIIDELWGYNEITS